MGPVYKPPCSECFQNNIIHQIGIIYWESHTLNYYLKIRQKHIILFYNRLVTAGKPNKVAIIACMCKLIVILNAMVKTNKPWDKSIHTA